MEKGLWCYINGPAEGEKNSSDVTSESSRNGSGKESEECPEPPPSLLRATYPERREGLSDAHEHDYHQTGNPANGGMGLFGKRQRPTEPPPG